MEGKMTIVKLTAGDDVRDFPIEVAEKLLSLNIPGGSQWRLSDESWEITDGRLRRKETKKKEKEKESK